MLIEYKYKKLEDLYQKGSGKHKYPSEVVRSYVKTIEIIRSVVSLQDLRNYRSLYFKQLKGNRINDYSIRLNKQWRLILQLKKLDDGTTIMIIDIENHYKE
jgi:proteic killer suppression protein